MDLSKWMLTPLSDDAGDGGAGGGDAGDKKQSDDQTPDDQKTTDSKTNDQGDKKLADGKSSDPNTGKKWEDERKAFIADLQKERKARQEFERKFQTLEGSLEAERKRVKALAGLDVASDEDKEIETYRKNLFKLAPGLEKLNPENVEKLLGLLTATDEIKQTTDHYWRSHGQTMVSATVKAVESEFGGDLSDRQKDAVAAAYLRAVSSDEELAERHERGDQKLVQEVAKQFIEDWITPARRQVTADEVKRLRKVPSGKDRSIAGQGQKKIDWKDPKSIEDAMVASFKEHGGQFGD